MGAVDWLPASRHHLFLTHALFVDNQVTLVFRDAGRAWGGFGGTLALAEEPEWRTRPQLFVSANIDTSFRVLGGPLDLRAETFDVRLAVGVDLHLSPELRLSIALQHASGHAADGVLDPSVLAPIVGTDYVSVRLVRDIGTFLRLGATLRPVLRSTPATNVLDANQFAELLPLGAIDSARLMTPYLAVALEEYGTPDLGVTLHVQTGIYYGSHLKPSPSPMVRMVLGYYWGADPRLKFARLLNSRVHFPYVGFMLHL